MWWLDPSPGYVGSLVFVTKFSHMKRRRIASLAWRVFQRSSICFYGPFDWQGIAYVLWIFSHISEACFASLISWGHLLVPCKSKLHHLSSRLCHVTTLKFEPHHLPFEWFSFTSCLQNLDNVTFLQHLKLVLHHLSSKGMSMQCQSFGGILLTSSRFCWHLFASSKSWWELLETSRFCWHLPASSKS